MNDAANEAKGSKEASNKQQVTAQRIETTTTQAQAQDSFIAKEGSKPGKKGPAVPPRF